MRLDIENSGKNFDTPPRRKAYISADLWSSDKCGSVKTAWHLLWSWASPNGIRCPRFISPCTATNWSNWPNSCICLHLGIWDPTASATVVSGYSLRSHACRPSHAMASLWLPIRILRDLRDYVHTTPTCLHRASITQKWQKEQEHDNSLKCTLLKVKVGTRILLQVVPYWERYGYINGWVFTATACWLKFFLYLGSVQKLRDDHGEGRGLSSLITNPSRGREGGLARCHVIISTG